MVHLSGVYKGDKPDASSATQDAAHRKAIADLLQLTPADDNFAASVYGSRFADVDLPKHQMPERQMPSAIAYRMIKDVLSLDGEPKLKLLSPPSSFLSPSAPLSEPSC